MMLIGCWVGRKDEAVGGALIRRCADNLHRRGNQDRVRRLNIQFKGQRRGSDRLAIQADLHRQRMSAGGEDAGRIRQAVGVAQRSEVHFRAGQRFHAGEKDNLLHRSGWPGP